MPFTPFHMGPALALKAVAGRHFSVLVFGVSQIMMDIEPLLRIFRGDRILHGFTHTLLGATWVAIAVVFLARPVCQWFLNVWTPDPYSPFLNWLRGQGRLTWMTTWITAFAGTYSHVFLDSLMHHDLQPFAPWSDVNPWLYVIAVGALHGWCVASGVAGFVLLCLAYVLEKRRRLAADSQE